MTPNTRTASPRSTIRATRTRTPPRRPRWPKRACEGSLISMKPPISTAPDILGGTPVFAGTRVPVQTLLDYLEAGDSIDDFLEGFPSVSRDQVISFLEMAKDRLIETTL